MTAAAWEAFTERAAILEYDGGFDRKTAILRAFALCFPGDYAECMKTAAETADGETALCDYLEGLIKTGPERAIGGATMNADTKTALTHGKAPDGPPMAKETRRKGFERMAEYARGRSA